LRGVGNEISSGDVLIGQRTPGDTGERVPGGFIVLDAGMTICQLIFEISLGTPAKGYAGQFSGQSAGGP
jgi:hypothetical protein